MPPKISLYSLWAKHSIHFSWVHTWGTISELYVWLWDILANSYLRRIYLLQQGSGGTTGCLFCRERHLACFQILRLQINVHVKVALGIQVVLSLGSVPELLCFFNLYIFWFLSTVGSGKYFPCFLPYRTKWLWEDSCHTGAGTSLSSIFVKSSTQCFLPRCLCMEGSPGLVSYCEQPLRRTTLRPAILAVTWENLSFFHTGSFSASFCPHVLGCRDQVTTDGQVEFDILEPEVAVTVKVPEGKSLVLVSSACPFAYGFLASPFVHLFDS